MRLRTPSIQVAPRCTVFLKAKAACAHILSWLFGVILFSISSSAINDVSGAPENSEQKPPNIIFIITDDQGYGDLSCHGNPVLKTPAIDHLYRESVRLTDYHVSPTCSPTRGALMSGHSANRAGTWSTTMGRSLLREGELTLGQVFQEGGYRTGLFGKWHLGDNYPFRAEDRGFEEVVRHGGGGVGQTPDYWDNSYFDDTYFNNGKPVKYDGYCTDVFFREAIHFIDDCVENEEPFFAYISTNAPHSPFHCPEEYRQPFSDLGLDSKTAAFLGMIANIDDNIAKLRSWLEGKQLDQETLLIFTTDNGTAAGDEVYNVGMRGNKMSPYDGGHRVPFFWHWPSGGLKGGWDIDKLTMHIDILPTLIDLCGLEAPANYEFEGKSLVPLLYQNDVDWPERVLITDSQRVNYPIKWKASAVMTERWRLINGEELYDIICDPGQSNDLSEHHPEVVVSLRAEYDNWWADISPTFPEYARIHLGSENENPSKLTSHDWLNDDKGIPWHQGYIRSAYPGPGFWAVEVEQSGTYQFELRRWPEELDREIVKGLEPGEPVSDQKAFREVEGKALPVVAATLSIGNYKEKTAVNPEDKMIPFTIELKKGQYQLECRFILDTEHQSIDSVGAFYVSVERL